jgi:[protein-PII] uridylyltransferase
LFEVLVMASDRSGLFARITGAFERLHLDIVSARIYTTTHNYALDTFLVLPKHHAEPQEVIAKIERDLKRAISSEAHQEMPRASSTRQSRQAKHFPLVPHIALRPSKPGGNAFYELSVTCSDRPGLLSSIARALHDAGVSVHDARITTLGSRAEDVFVIESTALDVRAASDALTERLLEVSR